MVLITINVGVALAELAINGAFSGNWIFNHGFLIGNGCCIDGHSVGITHNEWWRMVTSMFLHGGYLHLALNMYSLYYVGSILEIQIGRCSSSPVFRLRPRRLGGRAPLEPDVTRRSVRRARSSGSSARSSSSSGAGSIATGGQIAGLIVLNLVFTFALSSYISVGAHVGGLIGGVILMWLFHRFQRSPALYTVARPLP